MNKHEIDQRLRQLSDDDLAQVATALEDIITCGGNVMLLHGVTFFRQAKERGCSPSDLALEHYRTQSTAELLATVVKLEKLRDGLDAAMNTYADFIAKRVVGDEQCPCPDCSAESDCDEGH